MLSKEKTIVIELFERFQNREELSQAVVQDLKERGKQCQNVDNYTILVNNKPYALSERTLPIMGYMLRQAVLDRIEA
jgi:hypothetical protein